MNTATYTNRATGETYRLFSETKMTLDRAWNLAEWVCSRNGWNPIDIHVTKVSN